tara:strand:- start:191 stop:592 length:402 start_codon:yes stop_codon:yes gene_type:complete
MKYLSEIMEEKQTELFNKYNVFFAFNDEQFKEGLNKYNLTKDDKITNMKNGVFCPSKHVKDFINDHYNHYKNSIKEDMKQGKDKVILRELSNHECFYTGDISDCVSTLKDYPIKRGEIIKVYRKNYSKMTECY